MATRNQSARSTRLKLVKSEKMGAKTPKSMKASTSARRPVASKRKASVSKSARARKAA